MADMTPKSYFEETLPAKFTANPKIVSDVNAILEFQIAGPSGGTWTVDCSAEGKGKITEGSTGSAKTTVLCADQDFVNILTRKSNPTMAYMSGKLKVKGDLQLAMKLQKIL